MNQTIKASATLNMNPDFNVDYSECAIITAHDDMDDQLTATITIDWSSGTHKITVEYERDVPRHIALVIAQEASGMLDSFFDPEREPVMSMTLGF